MDFELLPLDEPAEAETDRGRDPGVYMGEERRQNDRRLEADRRELMRYGSARADRRTGRDRRRGSGFWESRYTL